MNDPGGISRRDCLKYSVAAVAGLTACAPREQASPGVEGGSAPDAQEGQLHESGSVPIARSGWAAHPGVQAGYPALEGDLATDVVVVGAGLAGCSLALHLAEAGVGVVVLEARQPGWGASGRNAGHVLPSLKDPEVIRRFPDGGAAFFDLFREHHTIPFELSKRLGIDCDAAQTGYLNATTSQGVFDDYKAASRFWQAQGQGVEYLDRAAMEQATGSTWYSHGVRYQSGGRVNPYLLCNGMLSAAIARGTRAFGNSEALSMTKAGRRWRVATAAGSVTAERAVYCTNAYPSGAVLSLANTFYPLTAYALCTRPLPAEAAALVMPSRATLAQVPVDLNPMVIDGDNRIITSSIPSASRPEDAAWHFSHHLDWLHRTWPPLRDFNIELEHYWTGRVALRDREFPGVYELDRGVYGLMHFNAWGNVMAPLLGMILAGAIASDRLDRLPFPLEKPAPVAHPGKRDLIIRKLLIPAARFGQRVGLV